MFVDLKTGCETKPRQYRKEGYSKTSTEHAKFQDIVCVGVCVSVCVRVCASETANLIVVINASVENEGKNLCRILSFVSCKYVAPKPKMSGIQFNSFLQVP